MFKSTVRSSPSNWEMEISAGVRLEFDHIVETIVTRIFKHATQMQRASVDHPTRFYADTHDNYLDLANKVDNDGHFVSRLMSAFLKYAMVTWNEPKDDVEEYILDLSDELEQAMVDYSFGVVMVDRHNRQREIVGEFIEDCVAFFIEEIIEKGLITSFTELLGDSLPADALINRFEVNCRKSTVRGNWKADAIISYT